MARKKRQKEKEEADRDGAVVASSPPLPSAGSEPRGLSGELNAGKVCKSGLVYCSSELARPIVLKPGMSVFV